MLKKIEGELRDIRHGMGIIRTAFVRNDLGDPDYEGHRQAHIAAIKKAEQLDGLKMAGTMKVVGAVAGAVVLIFATGLSGYITKMVGG